MLEALLVAIGVALLFAWNRRAQRPAPPQAAAPLRIARELNVEGTEAFKGSRSIVKTFGLNPQEVLDVRRAPGEASLETLPERVRECLTKVHIQGHARGQEVAQLAAGQRPIKANEALYFALVRFGQRQDEIVAFIAPA